MARKGILPRRKRGRASTASVDIDDANNSPHQRQINNANDTDSCNTNNIVNNEQQP